MTGPEHYREAEERLRSSDYQRQVGDFECAMHEAAVAQVHATLALAAGTTVPNYAAWRDVAGTKTETAPGAATPGAETNPNPTA